MTTKLVDDYVNFIMDGMSLKLNKSLRIMVMNGLRKTLEQLAQGHFTGASFGL